MAEKIGVSALRDTGVLYKGDLYDLACLILKIYDAKNKGTNTVSRHTVNGLTKDFAALARVDLDQILEIIKRYGLPLGATIEYDKDVE